MKAKVVALSTVLLFFSGCKNIDRLTQFYIDYNKTVVISSFIGINLPFNIHIRDIETNSEREFAMHDTRKNLIENINLSSLDITLTKPTYADFSFLESIQVYLSADDLPEILVAWQDSIPENPGEFIQLEVTDAELKEYIKKDQFYLRVNTKIDELIFSDHEIDVHSKFFVDAKIVGQ